MVRMEANAQRRQQGGLDTLAEEPELKVEHAPERRDSPPVPGMEMEPPCHPSPNESSIVSVQRPELEIT